MPANRIERQTVQASYYAFDLLWRDGDLRKLPQIERKQALLDLLGENDIERPVLFSEHLIGDGQQMFEHAAKLNWEGIISKRADAPYRSDRNENWAEDQGRPHGQVSGRGVYKTRLVSRLSISASRKVKTLSTWARLGPGGHALFPARSGNNSTLLSARNPN
jgi:hypothetical protein